MATFVQTTRNNMMRTKLFAIAAALLLAGCSAATTDPDYIGDIATITINCFAAEEKFGEIQPSELRFVTVIEMNDMGKPATTTRYDDNGNVDWVAKYTYNDEGQISTVNEYNSHGDLISVISYIHDGKFIKEQTYQPVHAEHTIKNEYRNYHTEYDNNGEYITEMRSYKSGELQHTTKIVKEGTTLRYTHYDAAGTQTNLETRFCNDKEQVVKIDSQTEGISEYTYNDHDLQERAVNTFFLAGNADRTTNICCGGDATYVSTYEYDRQGNWITRTVYEELGAIRSPKFIYTRTITYR